VSETLFESVTSNIKLQGKLFSTELDKEDQFDTKTKQNKKQKKKT
jgi:hypothetical protein